MNRRNEVTTSTIEVRSLRGANKQNKNDIFCFVLSATKNAGGL